jgi:hypothetical protein
MKSNPTRDYQSAGAQGAQIMEFLADTSVATWSRCHKTLIGKGIGPRLDIRAATAMGQA